MTIHTTSITPFPIKMKAWRLSAFNQDVAAAIQSLKLEEIPVPSPLQDDQVLVKLQYASVNPIDWKLFTGNYQNLGAPIAAFPYTPGFDVAGVVEESTSSSFTKGDKIIADLGLFESCTDPAPVPGGPAGAFAEYCVVPASLCVKVKGDLRELAGLPLAGLTSYQALFTGAGSSFAGEPLGDCKPGTKVLILGAAGGTGCLAVQMAKQAGCTVAATASSTPMPNDASQTKVDFVKSMGADTVIDYKTQDWAEVLKGQDYDLIYDCVGVTEDLAKAPKVLKKGGTFASIANFDPSSKSTDEVRFANFIIKSDAKDLQALVDMVEKGQLKVPIDSEYEFAADVPKALERSFGGRSVGKIIIKMA